MEGSLQRPRRNSPEATHEPRGGAPRLTSANARETTDILHLSDLHFASRNLVYRPTELKEGLDAVISTLKRSTLMLVLSGDITFKAYNKGYDEAATFFSELLTTNSIRPENVVLCPGNHDIAQGRPQPFEMFDAFSYVIRKDRKFTFGHQTHSLMTFANLALLAINTAYKLNPRYGYADVAGIRKTLKLAVKLPTRRVAILHHHLINQFEEDTSCVRNAYQLLSLLDHYHFRYLLHGHEHSNFLLPIGKSQMYVFGVRTFNFATKGYQNGFNHYRLEARTLRLRSYIYGKDVADRGKIGAWKALETETLK